MKSTMSNGTAEINPSSEMDTEGSFHQLVSASDTFRQVDNHEVEMAASSLDTLLRQIREASTREIEALIGDLQQLHKKLQNDGCRIQHDVEDYAELSQLVMQLTKDIADSLPKIPAAPGIVPEAD